MKIIGICGNSGSGKSTVSRFFEENNLPVLDCDIIYHRLVDAPSTCLDEIAKHFGKDVISSGQLDRKKLSAIVYNDRNKMLLLNEISHRHVKEQLEESIKQMEKENVKGCVIDAPMLFEANLDQRCDYVIAVVADDEVKFRRLKLRDNIDPEVAKKRISNQISDEELKSRANIIIENNGTQEELHKKCIEVLKSIF